MNKNVKFALYLPPEKKAELEQRYRENGCISITAFIEKSIDFFLGYLDTDISTQLYQPPNFDPLKAKKDFEKAVAF